MDMKDGDYIEHLFVCSSHDFLLFFSNRGKVYRSKVYELPEASRTAKGRALVNVLPLREGERIQSVLSTRDFSEARYLVFATRQGTVKKTEFAAYNTPIKADGIIAINIRGDDELVAVRRIDPDEEIIMISRAGLAVRFSEADARAMGRDMSGVRGMDVGEGGEVIAMAGALVVRPYQELVFISQEGMVQRTGVRGISQQGRAATGVRVMNVRDDDRVSAVALVVETDASTSAQVAEAAAEEGPVELSADSGETEG